MLPTARSLALLSIFLPALLAQGGYARARRSVAPSAPKPAAYKGITGSLRGNLKELSNKEIMIETEDKQIVSIRGPTRPGS
jgi:hypothetical protein